MNINELLITGFDGPATVFAATLTADEARVVKPGTDEEGDAIVGEAWKKATDAFTAIRDLMNDIVGTPVAPSS